MPDPRGFTVRQCGGAYASKSGAAISTASTERRSFFDAVGKVGDLNVLNSIGAGKIGQGLRTLASISDTIRGGCGALPTSIGGAIGGVLNDASTALTTGADWVLNNMGLGMSTVDAVHAFNPQVANAALGQAKVIFADVKAGNFKVTDIPNKLQDFQNLEQLGRNIFTPTGGAKFPAACAASPYAMDLVTRAPKYKFNFVVQFIFNAGYESLSDLDFAFVVKKSTRPNIRWEAQDVNYYNYRSKFITKTTFEDMQMSFHDEIGTGETGDAQTGNTLVRFFKAYMQAMSPITAVESWSALSNAEQDGMDFTWDKVTEGVIVYPNTASFTSLQPQQKTLIQEIRLFHVYNGGRMMDTYQFMNPRITNLTLDELDMSAGNDGSEGQLSFAYDSVYLQTGLAMNDERYDVEGQFRTAMYPLRFSDGETPPTNNRGTPTPTPSTQPTSCAPSINTKTTGIPSL